MPPSPVLNKSASDSGKDPGKRMFSRGRSGERRDPQGTMGCPAGGPDQVGTDGGARFKSSHPDLNAEFGVRATQDNRFIWAGMEALFQDGMVYMWGEGGMPMLSIGTGEGAALHGVGCGFAALNFFEGILAHAADGADPFIRELTEGRPRGDPPVRVSRLRIIDPHAYLTLVLVHASSFQCEDPLYA